MKKEIIISNKNDIKKAIAYLKEIDNKIDPGHKKLNELSIITGELAENILKHGQKGTIKINYSSGTNPFVEIISENIGSLPDKAEEDGHSTESSLGIGLGAVHRLSDKVSYEQSGKVLQIKALKYCNDFRSRAEIGVLSYPILGDEKHNGDSFVIIKNKNDIICVIDALGHGKDAHISAIYARNYIKNNHHFDIDKIVLNVHENIREKKLRGLMMSIARIDYERKKIVFCGIGDVFTKIYIPAEERKIYPQPKDGIVGGNMRSLNVQEFELIKGTIIAIFSDGVSRKLDIPLSMRNKRPVRLVHELMNKYGKDHDDKTLLLAKILS